MSDLQSLRTFTRLVELGSFSAVARQDGVKQSTVSKRLAALESELGIQLIERTTRSQRVTEPGRLFYQRALDVLAAYDDAIAAVSSTPAISGRLRVSVPVVFGELFVAPVVASFTAAYPNVELELAFVDRYVNIVGEGFDAAIRVGRPLDTTARAISIGVTPRRLVAAPAYVDRVGEPNRLRDLRSHRCLLHSGLDNAVTWQFDHQGRRLRASVRGTLAADNSVALAQFAKSGLGVALLAAWLVDDDISAGRLVRLLPDFEPPTAAIQLLLPPTRHVHPRVRAFADYFLVELRDTLERFSN